MGATFRREAVRPRVAFDAGMSRLWAIENASDEV